MVGDANLKIGLNCCFSSIANLVNCQFTHLENRSLKPLKLKRLLRSPALNPNCFWFPIFIFTFIVVAKNVSRKDVATNWLISMQLNHKFNIANCWLFQNNKNESKNASKCYDCQLDKNGSMVWLYHKTCNFSSNILHCRSLKYLQ